MSKKIILIGGGGHCKSCIDVIEKEGRFEIEGILDRQIENGTICDYRILGDDNLITEYFSKSRSFFITIGQIKNPGAREKIFFYLKGLQITLPVIVSPTAIVSKYSTCEEGTIIMHHAIVNADAKIGYNCIINNRALIEHDVVIGNHVHVSTGAIINGNCTVGSNVFIGSQSVINNGLKICDDVVIGSGSVIIKDISQPGVYAGNPIQKIK
jgi:sugar O-acyltransferase (sialic acid O-acetyltransferase NeuD family)